MKAKKNIKIYILIALIFTIFYILLTAKPLGKEYNFSPDWKINTSNPVIKPIPENQNKMHFHLGQTLGYFSEDGDISLFKTFPARTSISDSYYAVYDANAKNTPFFNNNGEQAGIIEASGYPYFIDDLIYVFLPGGASFSKCDSSGKVSWTYEGTLPITAFSAKPDYTAIGLADGTIKVFSNNAGKEEITFAPGGSDYAVVLGIDISNDGEYVASVSGHNQQRFVLSHREGNQQKIVFHTFLDTDSPYQTVVRFCNDGNRVLYNYMNKVGIYDLLDNSNTILNVKSKILSVDESDDFIFLLGKEKSSYTVSLIETTNTMGGSFSFEADTAFIKSNQDKLFVGKDNSISCITISKN